MAIKCSTTLFANIKSKVAFVAANDKVSPAKVPEKKISSINLIIFLLPTTAETG